MLSRIPPVVFKDFLIDSQDLVLGIYCEQREEATPRMTRGLPSNVRCFAIKKHRARANVIDGAAPQN
jgi:hypothetical protein